MTDDRRWMEHALRLSRRNLGATGSNPSVGCAIVAPYGSPVGVGWTARGGRPHAETQALAMAGERAQGATAYVTLEPCCHRGRTGPCTQALIEARIARVVTALEDPDPRVAGRGHRELAAAGIEVMTGIAHEEARSDLAGFLSRHLRRRPHVTLKLAVSADGKIAARPGERTGITGEPALRRAHLMRARADAIMVGVSTVIADDPSLTCRLPGLEDRSPLRLVVDSRLRVPETARVVREASDVATWLLSTREYAGFHGARIVACAATADGRVDLGDALRRLAGEGIGTVLVEGGARLARALLEAELVDEVALFRAPREIGTEGLDALAGLPLAAIEQGQDWQHEAAEEVGGDMLLMFRRQVRCLPA